MLLEKLKEYSARIDETPVMYKKTPIRWVINLDADGNYLGIVQTSSEVSGKKKDKGREYLAPTLRRTSGVKAILLADKVEYIFGLDEEGKQSKWADKCQVAFKKLIDRCAEDNASPSVIALKRFYESLDSKNMALPEGFKSGDLFTFSVDGGFPIDEPAVREFWATTTTGKKGRTAGKTATPSGEQEIDRGLCMVCGDVKPLVASMPIPIKNIPGNKAEYSLVTHNIKASESFGLERSHNSPICGDCGEAFCKALNDLLDKPGTHIRVGDNVKGTVYVFWTREHADFNAVSLLTDPQPEDVKRLLEKPLTGARASKQDDMLFYCAALSSSVTRVVVRDWLVTTLGEVQRNLARYFRAQSLVEWDGTEGAPLPLWKMTSSLTFKKETVAPNVPKAIFRFAFNGGELPLFLIFQAVKRERAEAGTDKKDKRKYLDYVYRNRSRMALIKMVLMSRKEYLNKEDSMEKVDLSNDCPAYLCGRLFGVIEAVQKTAMPGINATVTDRFYGTASTAPASVFGRLMKGCQNHISKLAKDKPGACKYLEDDLLEITSRLKTFPAILNLEEQGLFAIGFYHQKAHMKAAIEERKAKRAEEAAGE